MFAGYSFWVRLRPPGEPCWCNRWYWTCEANSRFQLRWCHWSSQCRLVWVQQGARWPLEVTHRIVFSYIFILDMGRTIDDGRSLLTCLSLMLPVMMSLIPPAMMTGIRIASACSGFMLSYHSASWPANGICSTFEQLRGLIPPERTLAALSGANFLSTRRVTATVWGCTSRNTLQLYYPIRSRCQTSIDSSIPMNAIIFWSEDGLLFLFSPLAQDVFQNTYCCYWSPFPSLCIAEFAWTVIWYLILFSVILNFFPWSLTKACSRIWVWHLEDCLQQETIRANVLGCVTLADVCYQKGIHMTYYGTGCIFHYDEKFPMNSGKVCIILWIWWIHERGYVLIVHVMLVWLFCDFLIWLSHVKQ